MNTRAFLIASAVVVATALFAALPARPASANNYGGWDNVHCVRWGETLYGIGYMYGVSAHSIAQYNGLWNPNYIRAGTCLRIPSHGYGYRGGYGHGGYDHDGYKGDDGHGGDDYKADYGYQGGYWHKASYSGGYGKHWKGVYCVKYGDTLSGIARWHGVSTWSIAHANGLWNQNYIRAGQCLTIPGW